MDRNKLIQEVCSYQKKLVKILKAEERLSMIVPINRHRLEKQAKARYDTINSINSILKILVDMRERFKLKRVKKL